MGRPVQRPDRARAGARALAWGGALLLPLGCQDPDLRIEALRGCGLDVELSQLRVTVRGDFPAEPVILSGSETLPPLDPDAVGITFEGLVGEAGVEAVGRTTRLDGSGVLPVYFAPEDSRCAVPSGVQFREPGAVAVGREGDVFVVGGSDEAGALLGEILLGRDTAEELEPIGSLPVPGVGQVVVPGTGRAVWVLGGAGPSGALASMVEVDPERGDDPVSDPVLLTVGDEATPRAHAGAAVTGEDRALVVGGCSLVEDDGSCTPSPESVLGSTIEVDLASDPPELSSGPGLIVPRYGATVLAARDGVTFVVGGRDREGAPVHLVERRDVKGPWVMHGPEWIGEIGPDPADPDDTDAVTGVGVAGAALLEPDLLVVALENGRSFVLGPTHADWIAVHPDVEVASVSRTVVALPGDRVLLDDFVLPVMGLDADLATDQGVGTDPSQVVRLAEVVPGPRRTGAHWVSLADGTGLLAGGRDPDTGGSGAGAFMLRVRPPLDGADERLPDLADLAAGTLVAHHPGAVREGPAVRITAAADPDPRFPVAGAHARGTRGRSLRFDVTLSATGATPYLVLWQGAVAARSIRLGSQVKGFRRGGDGEVASLGCGEGSVPLDGSTSLRFDIRADRIEVRAGGDLVTTCDGLGEVPASVGVAASGTGEVVASEFRLARL